MKHFKTNYTIEEIEIILKLYFIYQNKMQISYDNNINKNQHIKYYNYVVQTVNKWYIYLDSYEKEILDLKLNSHKTYDYIASIFGYANHSSIIRIYKNILIKIKYKSENE